MNEFIILSGDKPGEGTYRCINCGHSVDIDFSLDPISYCSNCNGIEFISAKNDSI
jgi:DNA-directed RNA polymerase subunit RPC12/RpoP